MIPSVWLLSFLGGILLAAKRFLKPAAPHCADRLHRAVQTACAAGGGVKGMPQYAHGVP